jgi:hypothetical protein
MDELVVVFGQASNGKMFLLGVFNNDKVELKKAYDAFKAKVGGEVAMISTELNQQSLFEL